MFQTHFIHYLILNSKTSFLQRAFSSVQFSHSVVSDSFFSVPHHSQSLLKLKSIESVMPSNHLIPCHPLLLLHQSFPASRSFPVSQFFASGGQSIGVLASASVLLMNIQDWFPLGLTGWISLQSKGLSRVFSSTTAQKHQFFGAQLYSTTLTSIHDYWKSHTFDYMDLCQQSDVSAF